MIENKKNKTQDGKNTNIEGNLQDNAKSRGDTVKSEKIRYKNADKLYE